MKDEFLRIYQENVNRPGTEEFLKVAGVHGLLQRPGLHPFSSGTARRSGGT